MPKIKFEQSEWDTYVRAHAPRRHPYFEKTVEFAKDIAVHADGEFPDELISKRRPSEDDEVLAYRKEIYAATTMPVFDRVYNSLGKIRRSADWGIRYAPNSEFPLIIEEESLEAYLEKKYPYFTSITNWTFAELLRKYIIDANTVILVRPIDFVVAANEYRKPVPYIFGSELVIDYVHGDYCVLVNEEGAYYMNEGRELKGESYWFITTQEIIRLDQVSSKREFDRTLIYQHGLNMLPAFKVGGSLVRRTNNYFLYKSRLYGMVPELKEAVREYSDLQASMVTSAYPTQWEYSQHECQDCKGQGRRVNPAWTGAGCAAPEWITCGTCNGRPYVVSGPYSKIFVKPVKTVEGESPAPTPPGGHLQKDVEIIKLQDASVDKHIYKALSALNFQFLDQSPLNVSGKKTEIDKDELNTTVHAFAEDLVAIMDNVVLITALYRYGHLYAPEVIIKDMLPSINVPEKYDLIGSSQIIAELKEAKDARANPALINEVEKDFAKKRFYSDPEVAHRVYLVLTLDPLANVAEDDKMSRLSNKGITQLAYVISSNINDLVQRAIDEDPEFETLPLPKQKAVIEKYALEIIAAIEAEGGSAAEIDDGFDDGTDVPGASQANGGGQTQSEGEVTEGEEELEPEPETEAELA